jgi:uncharacterized protein YgiM (DUF1202 family)
VRHRCASRLWLPMLILILGGMVSLAWADTVYVQAKTAKLRAGKTSLDPVVTALKYGEALEVVKKEGSWLQVKTRAGKTGWIFTNYTTTVKPSGGDSELTKTAQGFRGKEASDTTASAGARGLDKVSETYANQSGISQRHRDTVDRMTKYEISDQDVEEFIKKGELGEYAK